MTGEQFHDALTLLPEDLIARADEVRSRKPKIIHWRRYVSLAACCALLVLCGALYESRSAKSFSPEMVSAFRDAGSAQRTDEAPASGNSGAVDAGIAVSTIYRDNMNSERYSYTGVNNVTIGYDYGSLALKYADDTDSNVMVLLDSQEQDTESRLLISGIGKALEEQRRDMKLDTMKLNNSNTFEVEESIREYLKENHDKTDIIICTTLQQTQFTSQIAVDMNYVGDFKIIGSYQNDSVLEYLSSGVISANIVIDAAQMGKRAVDNLAEYLEYGHTSDYSQVDVHTIEQEDAIRQLNILQTEDESETGKEA